MSFPKEYTKLCELGKGGFAKAPGLEVDALRGRPGARDDRRLLQARRPYGSGGTFRLRAQSGGLSLKIKDFCADVQGGGAAHVPFGGALLRRSLREL